MKLKIWNGVDYRVSADPQPPVKEINIIGRIWQMRLLIPFGFSLWRSDKQVFRIHYPQT